jgi:lactoylglutathione lyase
MEVALVTKDVEGAFQRAISEGAVKVVSPVIKPWGQTVAYVREPDGFLVEICSPIEG